MPEPALYGISNSNRKKSDFWSKNAFNSSFPVALANYMRDKGIKAKYIKLEKDLTTTVGEISIDEVYNAKGKANSQLDFEFESPYEPYRKYSYDGIDGIDLVVKGTDGTFLRPLEIKLTVVPDNTTFKKKPAEWGSEIVVRAATTSYCTLGMMESCKNDFQKIRSIFEPVCEKIEKWDSSVEISKNIPAFAGLIDRFEETFIDKQSPLIMQPIWKTKGQSPFLDDEAFDIFVWSDYAFTRLFLRSSRDSPADNKVSRQMRCTARMARCIYEISKSGKVHLNDIYRRQMAFNYQTDKEFAASGMVTNPFMRCDRLTHPIIKKEELFNIVLNGGEEKLQPERRFDQTIFFTMKK